MDGQSSFSIDFLAFFTACTLFTRYSSGSSWWEMAQQLYQHPDIHTELVLTFKFYANPAIMCSVVNLEEKTVKTVHVKKENREQDEDNVKHEALNDKKTFLLWKSGVTCVCFFGKVIRRGWREKVIKINFNFMSHLEAVMFYKCLRKWRITVGKEHIRMINHRNGRFVTQISSFNDLVDDDG